MACVSRTTAALRADPGQSSVCGTRTCNAGRRTACGSLHSTRRELAIGALFGSLVIQGHPADAKGYDEKLKEKEARRKALRAAASEMKSTGKDEQIFEEPEYAVAEEARTPNVHSRQNEGARTQQNF